MWKKSAISAAIVLLTLSVDWGAGPTGARAQTNPAEILKPVIKPSYPYSPLPDTIKLEANPEVVRWPWITAASAHAGRFLVLVRDESGGLPAYMLAFFNRENLCFSIGRTFRRDFPRAECDGQEISIQNDLRFSIKTRNPEEKSFQIRLYGNSRHLVHRGANYLNVAEAFVMPYRTLGDPSPRLLVHVYDAMFSSTLDLDLVFGTDLRPIKGFDAGIRDLQDRIRDQIFTDIRNRVWN